MYKRRLFSAALLLFFSAGLLCANIFNRPRRIKVLSTRHFDFIFPIGAEKTVSYLSTHADDFFESAAEKVNLLKPFRIPVAVTFDSDSLGVEYTPDPYNRIKVYAAPGEAGSRWKDDALLDSFNETVTKAVFSSKSSRFWQSVRNVSGMDAIQPAALLNIPSSFMDGAVNTAVYGKNGMLSDGFSLSQLSRAKAEGKFPSWIDAVGAKDNYPTEISSIAATAFAAYMQGRFGLEKYMELFERSGSVQFFSLTAGIFKKVYGRPIREVWNDFKDSIPQTSLNTTGENIFIDDTESGYRMLLEGEKSLIFYDPLHSEISGIFKIGGINLKERLFPASGMTDLAISADKKTLAFSYKSSKTNRSLSKSEVLLFNLEKRAFTGQVYNLRNGTIIDHSVDGEAVAGFHTSKNRTFLQVYPIKYEFHRNMIFSKELPPSVQTVNIVSAGTGKIICVYYFRGKCVLHLMDLFYGTEKFYHLPLRAVNFKKEGRSISFTWTEENSYESAKRGILMLGSSGEPEKALLQNEDFLGGVYDSVQIGSELYFSSRRAKYEELKKVGIDKIEISREIEIKQIEKPENPEWEDADETIESGVLNGFQIKRYNMAKYALKGSVYPFFPISSINLTTTSLAPGLGFTYITNTDPLENITGAISACGAFIDTSEKTFTLKKGHTLAAQANTTVFPFDIALSALWNFTTDGSYDITTILGTEWNSIVGLPYNRLSFGVKGMWNCSTTYYDYEKETVTELSGWPNISRAYNTLTANLSANYSNTRQYGTSSFEKIGISASASFIAIYDRQKMRKEVNGNASSQFTLSANFGFDVPFLLPFFGLEDWVICMPLNFYTEWYSEKGISSETYAEVLLAGYEVQRGIPILNIFVKRVGIKAGYNLRFKYDTFITADPDIRNIWTFISTLQQSNLDDFAYITLTGDFSPAFGKFSSNTKIGAGVQFQLHYRENRGSVKAILNMNL